MSNTIEAFVYIKAQVSVPLEEYDWCHDNQGIRKQPGFISKTWLSGADNN